MRSARFSRREQSRFCAIAHASKVGPDFGKSQRDVTLDIFEEDPARSRIANDACDVWPEVPRVGGAEFLPRG